MNISKFPLVELTWANTALGDRSVFLSPTRVFGTSNISKYKVPH